MLAIKFPLTLLFFGKTCSNVFRHTFCIVSVILFHLLLTSNPYPFPLISHMNLFYFFILPFTVVLSLCSLSNSLKHEAISQIHRQKSTYAWGKKLLFSFSLPADETRAEQQRKNLTQEYTKSFGGTKFFSGILLQALPTSPHDRCYAENYTFITATWNTFGGTVDGITKKFYGNNFLWPQISFLTEKLTGVKVRYAFLYNCTKLCS